LYNHLVHIEYTFRLRPGSIDDADQVGKIIFEAFSAIAEKHGFQSDFPSVGIGSGLASSFLSNPGFYSVVAEDTGGEDKDRVVGSNFLDERSNIVAGVGPITVDPKYQNKGTGRQLMINVLERARNKNFPAIRCLSSFTNTNGRPPSKTCLTCNRKSVYPEKVFGDWFYPRVQICFDCIMIDYGRYDKIRARKLPEKIKDRAELFFPLTICDTSNNTKIGEYHTKQEVLDAVDKYKQERKSRAKILVIHYPTFYNFTEYFTG
jgi:predicted N-acetyltransferase YhbS